MADIVLSGTNAGVWVEDEAKRVGVSVNKICAKAKVARSTIFRWKRGDRCARIDSLERIQQALASEGVVATTNREDEMLAG